MYGATALFFFVVGGCEALLIRLQLARPNGTILGAETYNELFTMHGTTMVFLFIMPMAAAFSNYFIPLQIGARDVAFPRLNAFSYWCFLFGGIFLNLSWFLGGAPDGGWFERAEHHSRLLTVARHGLLGARPSDHRHRVAVRGREPDRHRPNMRAPGMSLMKMPIFTWMALVIQFLLLFAIPVITVALFLLLFDRQFGANFFEVKQGADPLLWQHLFWIFGHPEVYILILPSFGIVSEVLPVFSRKPLFGYPFVVFSGVAIGFMGWGVWAHHMFASSIGPVSVAAFSLSTMFIAVPTGVKIINWLATMWGGRLRLTVAMMFAIGLVVLFTIGGLSGVAHAVAPSDTQQTDTYYIVAHFHYVLFGGAVFGLFAGFYYWWPKVFGKMLSETLGKINFWLMFIGMNLTFGPMHIIGLEGQPRRMYRYAPGMGFDTWNLIESIGAFILAAGILVFLINVIKTARGPKCPEDPWDARTIEWMTTSPPKPHNYDAIPQITHLDEYWHRKYEETEDGHGLRRVATYDEVMAAEVPDQHIHMPSPSYWPIVIAAGLPLIATGIIFSRWIAVIGALIVFGGIYALALEPATAPEAPHDEDHHDEPHEPDTPAATAAEVPSEAPESSEAADEPEAVPVD